ncbi:MAG: CBS domain-containing protein [Thermoprotei archaeon]|nr:CBS domain-containing protein [Thermoprotei archaeon]
MRRIAFLKVCDVMNNYRLIFSCMDSVSKFLGELNRSNCCGGIVRFEKRVGIVTALDVLGVSHPERTLLGNVAKRAVSLNRESTLLEAVDFMISNGLKVLPVMEDKVVIGMVFSSDILSVMADSNVLEDVACRDVMKVSKLSVSTHDRVSTAKSIMCRHDVDCLPVVDKHGFLKGIITARDIVLSFLKPDESTTRGEIVGESVSVFDSFVEDLMDSNPLIAKEDDPLVDIVNEFKRTGKEVCVVMTGDGFGIITPMEIISLLLKFKAKDFVHVRFLGLPISGDFLGLGAVQDKIARVLKSGFVFHKGVREVIVDVKPRKRSGKRVFYQVIARVYSSARPLVVTAHGWYLAEAISRLRTKLDRVLRRSKRRRKRTQGRYSRELLE